MNKYSGRALRLLSIFLENGMVVFGRIHIKNDALIADRNDSNPGRILSHDVAEREARKDFVDDLAGKEGRMAAFAVIGRYNDGSGERAVFMHEDFYRPGSNQGMIGGKDEDSR